MRIQEQEQFQSQNSHSGDIRLRLFQAASLVFVVAPFLGEFAAYDLNGKPNGSLASSVTMIIATLLNYLWYRKKRNLETALQLTSFVQLLCFCWGLIAAGGIYAGHMVYMPFFPVMNGFIFGKKGSILSAGFTAVFLLFLAIAAKLGWTERPLQFDAPRPLRSNVEPLRMFFATTLKLNRCW